MSSHAPHAAPHTPAHTPAAATSTPWLLQKYKWKIMAVVGAIALLGGGGGGYVIKKNIDASEANEFRENARVALTHIEELKTLWVSSSDRHIQDTTQALQIFINMGNDAINSLWGTSSLIVTLNSDLEKTITTINDWGTSDTIAPLLENAANNAHNIETSSLESIQKELSKSIKDLKEDIGNQPKKYSWLNGNYFSDSWGENVSDAFGIDANTFDAHRLTTALDALEKNPDLFSQSLDDPLFQNLFLDALKVKNGHSQLLKENIGNKAELMKAVTGLLRESQASNISAGAEKIPGNIVNILWLLYILWALFGWGARYFQAYKEIKNPTPPDPSAPPWTPTRAETLVKKWNDWMKYWVLTQYVGKFSKDYIWRPIWWTIKKTSRWSLNMTKNALHHKKHQKKLSAIAAEKQPILQQGTELIGWIESDRKELTGWGQYLAHLRITQIPTKIAPIDADMTHKKTELATLKSDITNTQLAKTTLESDIQKNTDDIKDFKARILAGDAHLVAVLQAEIQEKAENVQKLSQVSANIATLESEKTKKESEIQTLENAKKAFHVDDIITSLLAHETVLRRIHAEINSLDIAHITDSSLLHTAWEKIKKLDEEYQKTHTWLAADIQKSQQIQQLIT